jgi:hypothetical protein
MAATTINTYSVELNQGPPGATQTYAPLRPNQLGGRVRFMMFTYTAASDASGANIALAKLPKGARIFDIQFAVATSLGSATMAFGLAGANGNGYIDDGSTISNNGPTGIAGADSIGAAVADSTTCIAAATTYTTTNTKVQLITPTVAAYSAAPAAEGVISIGTSAWLYMLAKDCYLTATVGTAALTTQKMAGYILYTID